MFKFSYFAFIGFALTLAMVDHASAQAPSPTPSPTPVAIPKIEKVIGQPVTMTWDDGRQATLEINTPITELFPLPIELVENSCDSARQMLCEYRAGLSVAAFRIAWTKHPDTAKIGKPVLFTYPDFGQSTPLFTPGSWTMINHMLNPGAYAAVPRDELSCPSWSWLGLGSSLPPSLNIPSISTEFMFPNPNTGISENRTVMTAADISWKQTTAGALQVQNVASFNSFIPFGVDVLFVGDVMKWTIEKSKNQYCDAGFKVNIATLRSVFGKLLERTTVDQIFVPYVYRGVVPYENSTIASVLEAEKSFLEKAKFE